MESETDWLCDVAEVWMDSVVTNKFSRLHDDRSERVYEAAPKWPVRERVGELNE